MKYRLIFYITLSIASYFASVRWAHNYKYEDYKDYLTLISGISGMVFTIMGIWIAFLYPNAMNRIINSDKIIAKDFSESKSDAQRLESIVGAIMTSAIVAVAALLITLAKIIIFLLPIYIEYKQQLKATALSTLIFMTLIQLESVFHVIISNIMFINDLHFKTQARKSDADL